MQFCPTDRGMTRNVEVARFLRRLGVHLERRGGRRRRPIAYGALADLVYPIPSGPASLAPLLTRSQVNAEPRRRPTMGGSLYGMAERVHQEDGDPQIYESEIIA